MGRRGRSGERGVESVINTSKRISETAREKEKNTDSQTDGRIGRIVKIDLKWMETWWD